MDDGENKVKQEDCSEDKLGPGILTLTNKRLAFDKTQARIMDFTKRMGDTVDRKSTRLNSSHSQQSRMPSSA